MGKICPEDHSLASYPVGWIFPYHPNTNNQFFFFACTIDFFIFKLSDIPENAIFC